jgi:hypothetical protein
LEFDERVGERMFI